MALRPKSKVPVYGAQAKKTVLVENNATEGATIGQDLRLPDGSVPTLAQLAAALGVGTTTPASGIGGLSITLWSLIQEIPSDPLSVLGNPTNVDARPVAIVAGTDGDILRRSGTTLGFGLTLPGAYVFTTPPILFGLTAAQVASFPLDVSGSSANTFTSIYLLGGHGALAAGEAPLFWGGRIGTSIDAPTAVTAGNSLVQIRGFGYDGDELALGGQFSMSAGETFTETARGIDYRFDLVPHGAAVLGRAFAMRGTSTGGFVLWAEVSTAPTEPTYSWRADANTGLGRSGADELTFITGGVQRAIVNAGGAVVIGHTATISIAGSTQTLQVFGTTVGGVTTGRWSNSAGGAPQWTLMHSRGVTIGSLGALTNGDTLGIMQFAGDDGTDYATRGAAISAIVENTVSTGILPTRLDFSVQQAAGGALATVLRLSSTLQAMAEVGTAALPSWTYRQDPDTGRYRAGSNIEGWSTGGVHRVTLDGSGRLLIGTPLFTAINSGGSIGQFQVIGTSLATSGSIQARFSADNGFAFFNFLKSRAAAPASFTIVQAGDQIGRLSWSADDGVDYGTLVASQNVTIDGTPAADAISGYWELHVNSGAATATELLRGGRYSNTVNEAYLRLTGNTNDTGTIDRTSAGIELLAGTVPDDGLFPLIKWISTDSSFSTNNPRMVAFIGARSTQAYSDDNDGGARIVFGSHANDPGTGDPTIYAFMSPAEFEFTTTLFDINATTVDISGQLLIPTTAADGVLVGAGGGVDGYIALSRGTGVTAPGYAGFYDAGDVRRGYVGFHDSASRITLTSENGWGIRVTSAADIQVYGSSISLFGTGETLATFVDDGAVTLYHDNVSRIATSATGVDMVAGLFLTVASASGSAGFRLPHGAAPSAPADGDTWTTTAGLFVRINGVTVGPLS